MQEIYLRIPLSEVMKWAVTQPTENTEPSTHNNMRRFSDHIHPNQFAHMKKAQAIIAYLEFRRRDATYDEIIRVLEIGGCQLPEKKKGMTEEKWQSECYRIFKIVLSQNQERFYDDNGKVGLVSWKAAAA